MVTYVVDPRTPNQTNIEKAAAALQSGGLVAFPTETVYGLGANGLDAAACRRIYEAKGRPSDNPLILHIAHRAMLAPIAADVPPLAEKLMDAFWPGPLTLIFPKTENVPASVTGGLSSVAVRFPSHPVAQALIAAAGVPVAAPSANTSGKPSPTKAEHVAEDLGGKIEVLLDGGACEVGVESTIVDVTGPVPVLLRPGGITPEMLTAVVGEVEIDPVILEKPREDLVPRAPGMKYRHYAPKAPVVLLKGSPEAVAAFANEAAAEKKVGVLATEETAHLYKGAKVLSLGSGRQLEAVAQNLFSALREMDHCDVEQIFCEAFPETGTGLAVMNRLKKAAAYTILEV